MSDPRDPAWLSTIIERQEESVRETLGAVVEGGRTAWDHFPNGSALIERMAIGVARALSGEERRSYLRAIVDVLATRSAANEALLEPEKQRLAEAIRDAGFEFEEFSGTPAPAPTAPAVSDPPQATAPTDLSPHLAREIEWVRAELAIHEAQLAEMQAAMATCRERFERIVAALAGSAGVGPS